MFFRKLLGQFGIIYCPNCGRKLVEDKKELDRWEHGYGHANIHKCPHCSNQERFNI